MLTSGCYGVVIYFNVLLGIHQYSIGVCGKTVDGNCIAVYFSIIAYSYTPLACIDDCVITHDIVRIRGLYGIYALMTVLHCSHGPDIFQYISLNDAVGNILNLEATDIPAPITRMDIRNVQTANANGFDGVISAAIHITF